jgi:hypothetical protein
MDFDRRTSVLIGGDIFIYELIRRRGAPGSRRHVKPDIAAGKIQRLQVG